MTSVTVKPKKAKRGENLTKVFNYMKARKGSWLNKGAMCDALSMADSRVMGAISGLRNKGLVKTRRGFPERGGPKKEYGYFGGKLSFKQGVNKDSTVPKVAHRIPGSIKLPDSKALVSFAVSVNVKIGGDLYSQEDAYKIYKALKVKFKALGMA